MITTDNTKETELKEIALILGQKHISKMKSHNNTLEQLKLLCKSNYMMVTIIDTEHQANRQEIKDIESLLNRVDKL